jgi:hypothetical protein
LIEQIPNQEAAPCVSGPWIRGQEYVIREDRQIAAGHLASRDNAGYLLQHEQPVLNKTQRYQLQMLDSIID